MSSNPLMGSSRLPPSNGVQNLPRSSSNGRSSSSTHSSSPSITLERVMKEHHSSNSSQSVIKGLKDNIFPSFILYKLLYGF